MAASMCVRKIVVLMNVLHDVSLLLHSKSQSHMSVPGFIQQFGFMSSDPLMHEPSKFASSGKGECPVLAM
jgi:hypothetical protein